MSAVSLLLILHFFQELKPASFSEMMQRLKRGEANMFSVAYSMLLERTARELEIIPGEEFRVAYEEALKVRYIQYN